MFVEQCFRHAFVEALGGGPASRQGNLLRSRLQQQLRALNPVAHARFLPVLGSEQEALRVGIADLAQAGRIGGAALAGGQADVHASRRVQGWQMVPGHAITIQPPRGT